MSVCLLERRDINMIYIYIDSDINFVVLDMNTCDTSKILAFKVSHKEV